MEQPSAQTEQETASGATGSLGTPHEQEKTGVLALLKHGGLLRLMLASAISRFGDSVDAVAYAWMVYEITGSKLLMGTLFAVNALPNLLFSLAGGIMADRLPKKLLAAAGSAGRGLAVCITAVLYATGELAVWHLFVITFLNSTLEALSAPAHKSLLRTIVEPRLLLQATSYREAVSRSAELIGLAAAGGIIAASGIPGALLVDAFTFWCGACLLATLPIKEDIKKREKKEGYIKGAAADMKEALLFIRSYPVWLLFIVLIAFINFCLVPFNVLSPAYVKDVLHAGPEGISIIDTALVLGMIAGGAGLGQFGSRFRGAVVSAVGLTGLGITYALLSAAPLLPVPALLSAAVVSFVMGCSVPLCATTLASKLLGSIPAEMTGRIVALLTMLSGSAIPVGSVLTGLISEAASIPALFAVMGTTICLTGLALMASPRWREQT
jgi:MFS transporter, DHA3 family, macrolide efflux protein